MKNVVNVFDTTLRDGEQSPGVTLDLAEKIMIAKQLASLGVDTIEAGFPITSNGDFESVRTIAETIKGPEICGLARAVDKDIDRAGEAIRVAQRSKIHVFLATSDIHMKHKLNMSRNQVLLATEAAVKRATRYTDAIEFSAEDATRSDPEFLAAVLDVAIAAGATVVNIPDTVGYTMPTEFGNLISYLRTNMKNIERAVISVHCHNDLGLAVANSLAAIENGARQVECTVNGIGERAGNCAMEEVAMALYVRSAHYKIQTALKTAEIYKTSRLVSSLTGMIVQKNKAVVGENAFAHEAGIHQDGVLKEPTTYEIMEPAVIGLDKNRLVLGKHSGRHALRERLFELGYDVSGEQLLQAFKAFKALADKKKQIFDQDLVSLLQTERNVALEQAFKIVTLETSTCSGRQPQANLTLDHNGELKSGQASGDGPVDAIFQLIAELTGTGSTLESYVVEAITGGTDAQGKVTVSLRGGGRTVLGRGADTDILMASAIAYIEAINILQPEKE